MPFLTPMGEIRNKSPDDVEEIGDLVKEGDSALTWDIIWGGWEPPVHRADEYYTRALQLMRGRGIENKEAEYRACIGLAKFLTWVRHYEEALPHSERAVQLEPVDGTSRYIRAYLYNKLGHFADGAMEWMQAARFVEPGKLTFVYVRRAITDLFWASLLQPSSVKFDVVKKK